MGQFIFDLSQTIKLKIKKNSEICLILSSTKVTLSIEFLLAILTSLVCPARKHIW